MVSQGFPADIPKNFGEFRCGAAFRFVRYCQGQYRTKSVWRICTPSACKFPVIFHKNAREYIKYSLRFLFHLTKNLTTHLSHNLCAVLPKKIFPQGAPRGNISIYSNISKAIPHKVCISMRSPAISPEFPSRWAASRHPFLHSSGAVQRDR